MLVVDDEASIREVAGETLAAHGYRALTAADGTQALALYAQRRGEIRAVLMDMMMPFLDGQATIRALRHIDPELPILAVSGLGPGSQRAEDLGVRFLPKPYSTEMLLTALRDALDGRTAPPRDAS